MDTPLTSEEKLLKLIRKKNNLAVNKEVGKNQKVSGPRLTFSFGKGFHVDILSLVNGLLLLAALGVLSFLIGKFFIFNNKPMIITEEQVESPVKKNTEAQPLTKSSADFDTYKNQIGQRDIFQLPWEREVIPETADTNLTQDLSQQIKVIGILLDNDPKAIVEDITGQQTLFMSKGEHIGNAVLEDIQEDKVIFMYNNKKVELAP